jgi:signal transduction histidine kinase
MPVAITVQRALLGAVGIALVAGLFPAAVVLDRRLAEVLYERAKSDLALAPRVLADRAAANANALMMYAKDMAHLPGLGEALRAGDRQRARRIIAGAPLNPQNATPVLIGPGADAWLGSTADPDVLDETRAGRMPVTVRAVAERLDYLALAPVQLSGQWVGAAGVSVPIDEQLAALLAGLTRSGVVVLGRSVVTSTLDSVMTLAVARAARAWSDSGVVHDLSFGGHRVLAVTSHLGGTAVIVFTRDLATELAALPELRRLALFSIATGILLALLLGAALAARISRPIRELAVAAEQIRSGAFDAPLPRSRIREVSRVATTFDAMRRALAARLSELRHANEELSDRNARLSALQSDLVRRERLDATGRLVAQLTHEIRNPVANVRNLLELVRRRVMSDPEARGYADMATEELLRMHSLAEQLLHLNRPPEATANVVDAVRVAREVATLVTIGTSPALPSVDVTAPESVYAAIGPDSLKQVLLNLVQNAREATTGRGSTREPVDIEVRRDGARVTIEVRDRGPGIPEDTLERIFDPFFTTKGRMDGVGLGLFVAEGLVRSVGGRIMASNRSDGSGARFVVQLPLAPDLAPSPVRERDTRVSP